nr:MAG TPA: zinc-ribbon containing domain protein [Caudoviricetes sp.]
MKNILEHGSKYYSYGVLTFYCKACGCRFEASEDGYTAIMHTDYHNGCVLYKTASECPECNAEAYSWDLRIDPSSKLIRRVYNDANNE